MANSREVVVVTGGSAGLGRATAVAFAREGADVAVLARGEERLAQTREQLERFGVRALALPVDVADAAAVEDAAAAIESQLGEIDIWVNNAMVSVFSPVLQMKPNEYHRVTEVTYLGAVHGTLAALRRMIPRDRGVIVQVGSALAYRAIPLQSAYCAAKHAVQGFTESLRSELFHDGSRVRVCMVQMPALNTPQFDWVRSRLPRRAQPVPPVFQPEVGAAAVVFAAHHDRSEMYVGFPSVKAIVANRVAPRLLDRYLGRVGFDDQQTDEPEHERPDNLFAPAPGDWAAHGRFDEHAKPHSLQLWASTHRRALVWTSFALLGVTMMWRRQRR